MLAHRKHSIKVQDSLVKSVTLNRGGVGTNLLPEVKCHWLLHLVTVSYCCSNFTLERCSQSGLSRARERAENSAMKTTGSPVSKLTD